MSEELIVSEQSLIQKIYVIRGKQVMLDSELAILYGVTTGNLNKAVGRNNDRFPDGFMFELSAAEFTQLKTESGRWGGRRRPPKVFTEQGVAMLSGVLHSKRAIMVNIQIMRVYSRMRELLLTHRDLLVKLEEMERKVAGQDKNIQQIFDYLKQFVQQQNSPRPKIGFKPDKK